MQEVKTFCYNLEWVEYIPVIDFVPPYFEILSKDQHKNFIDAIMKFLETDVFWKMPYPSDVVRIDNELNRIVNLHGKMNRRKEGNTIVFEPVIKIKKIERPKLKRKDADAEIIHDEVIVEDTDRGAFIENTIDEYLEEFKDKAISKQDVHFIIKILKAFFEGKKPKVTKAYSVGYGKKKKLGYILGSLYRVFKKHSPLSFEYFDLCRQLFECYKQEIIEKNSLNKSNLHKYFTTKTQ